MRWIGFLILIFSLSVFVYAQPANDDCANAIDIGDISSTQTLNADFTLATESMDASCEMANNNNRDLWYMAMMPFDGNILVDGISGIDRVTVFTQCGGVEISCQVGDQLITALTGGQVYLLRFSTTLSNHSTTPEVTAFALAGNDNCQGATTINDLTAEQNVQLDARMATQSLSLPCDPANISSVDLWYAFTMPFDGRIIVDGVSALIRIGVLQGCGGMMTEIDCKTAGGFFDDLSGGELYYLRYAVPSNFAGPDDFSVQAFDLVSHDECSTPLGIGDISKQIAITADTRHASESLQATCETNPENLDLWYSFPMPFDGSVRVTGVFGVNRIAFFQGCNTELACLLGSGFAYGLMGGQHYLLRYAAIPAQAMPDQFFVQAFAPPPHDECTQALDLGDISAQVALDLDVREATESIDVTCEDASADNLDLWYRFTMPFSGKVNVTGVFGVNKITLFDACGGNEISCQEGNAFFYGLQSNVSYILRYAAVSNQATADQIFIQAFPPPPNDECVAPIVIADIDQAQTINVDVREATESLVASCENGGDNNLDLWYEFSLPYEANLQVSGVFGMNRVGVYQDCNTEISCNLGNALFFSLPAGTHLFRYAAVEQQAGQDAFTVQAFVIAANDDCSDAEDLGDISLTQMVQVNSAPATEEIDATCEIIGDDNIDLWYRFVMPFDGQMNISGANAAYRFTLFDQCQGTELSCFNGNGSANGLLNGREYLLRYACNALSAGLDGFSIHASAALPVELLYFKTRVIDKGTIALTWKTATEIDHEGFAIERSTDDSTWVQIGWISGTGFSHQEKEYFFNDISPAAGLNYYRLVQHDLDGTISYSVVQYAFMDYEDDHTPFLYPNPAREFINLENYQPSDRFELFDIDGKFLPIRISPQGSIDIHALEVGIYLLRWIRNNESRILRFMVQ